MSKFTKFLDKSTSVTSDLIISAVVGAFAGALTTLLPITTLFGWLPLVEEFDLYLPFATAAAVAIAIYHRQRVNLRSPPPSFE